MVAVTNILVHQVIYVAFARDYLSNALYHAATPHNMWSAWTAQAIGLNPEIAPVQSLLNLPTERTLADALAERMSPSAWN